MWRVENLEKSGDSKLLVLQIRSRDGTASCQCWRSRCFGNQMGAGDIMYKDLDGKPGITRGAQTLDDHGDLKVIGNSTPRYFFGIDLSADWKGFDLRCFFQGVLKRD